ncbi:NAD-dependent protein deacylase [termite gut metagenome]|uniref:NAD-dependent protein deacylase n=1 Tax=termite gut metagenome TaxID=433724 RepID=A0A5J4QWK1_9ZZZZ
MDNLLTSLAFSIYSNKKVYALLIGSGISAPSGIPTGWSILMDLIRKIAAMEGPGEINDLEKWYIDKYNSNLDYSEILSKLVKTQTERVNLLRPYFEPTLEEKENGLKTPTKAHRAIAKMTQKGYFKVILTTNFDRLLEKAFEDEGIIPHVIYHEDDIDGATPLVHASCIIVKINGDYIDCRFKNTAEELSQYSDKLNNYLTKIFEDFGLITCGWSGLWDKALISQIRASVNRRYAGYYTYKGHCETPFKELCEFRNGELLEIKSADIFFTELAERVNALESLSLAQHPLNKDIAVARVKKYIVKPASKILLNDMVQDEVRRTREQIDANKEFTLQLTPDTWQAYWAFHMHNVDTLIPIC